MEVKILIVDDEISMDKLVRKIFRGRQGDVDYSFHYESSGDAAYAYLRQNKDGADIVLLDINMPGQLNGLALLAEMKKINLLIKTIMISAYGDMERSRFAIQNGAFDFIQKPVEPEDLRISVKRAADQVVEMKKVADLLFEVDILKYFVNSDVVEIFKRLSVGEFMKRCRKEVGTVLVADIKGYTAKSRTMKTVDLIKLLNEYFTEITRSVYAHRGGIDKFIGDCAMAVFRGPDHLENAVAASLEIRGNIGTMNRVREINNEEKFSVGMGLSSGEIIQGNIGSIDPVRLDHTFIGDTINMGFRIQEIAGANEILFIMNEHTASLLSVYTCQKCSATKVGRGVEHLDIYRLEK